MKIQFDIIEVVLKEKLGIDLTAEEEKWLKDIELEHDMKQTVMDLIDDPSYSDEIECIINKILTTNSSLPITKQEEIKKKYLFKNK